MKNYARVLHSLLSEDKIFSNKITSTSYAHSALCKTRAERVLKVFQNYLFIRNKFSTLSIQISHTSLEYQCVPNFSSSPQLQASAVHPAHFIRTHSHSTYNIFNNPPIRALNQHKSYSIVSINAAKKPFSEMKSPSTARHPIP